MSRHDYLPAGQVELREWVENADRLLCGNASRFGLMQAEVQSLHERIVGYIEALQLSLGTTTRNVGTIGRKNMARVLMLQLLRPICMRIRDDLGVAESDKLALRLTLPKTNPSPINPPETAPVLTITSDASLGHRLTYRDQATPNRSARPDAAVGLQLYRLVSPFPTPQAPTASATDMDLTAAQFVGFVTRQPFRLQYAHADALRTVHYWARWQTARGLVGPWGPPASRVVA